MLACYYNYRTKKQRSRWKRRRGEKKRATWLDGRIFDVSLFHFSSNGVQLPFMRLSLVYVEKKVPILKDKEVSPEDTRTGGCKKKKTPLSWLARISTLPASKCNVVSRWLVLLLLLCSLVPFVRCGINHVKESKTLTVHSSIYCLGSCVSNAVRKLSSESAILRVTWE